MRRIFFEFLELGRAVAPPLSGTAHLISFHSSPNIGPLRGGRRPGDQQVDAREGGGGGLVAHCACAKKK